MVELDEAGTGYLRSLRQERKTLERMLEDAPSTPISHLETAFQEINGSTLPLMDEPPKPKLGIPSSAPAVKLPSLLPWCRQCNRYGHIDYTKVPCARCSANHQTSACPITIMGMCVYCSAVGVHFSQLCPQRKVIPFCDFCGKSDHETDSCSVI